MHLFTAAVTTHHRLFMLGVEPRVPRMLSVACTTICSAQVCIPKLHECELGREMNALTITNCTVLKTRSTQLLSSTVSQLALRPSFPGACL